MHTGKGGKARIAVIGTITWRALRRTFAILSLRAGMSPTHLQALGGWSGLEMVTYYAQLEDVDLLQAHAEHGPLDSL